MGEIADMISAIKEVKNSVEGGLSKSEVSFSIGSPKNTSLSSLSLQGTANFPVLVSDSIDIDDAMMISKALERKFATFFVTVLTMNPYMAVPDGKLPSASRYLSQFHRNMTDQGDRLITRLESAMPDIDGFLCEQFNLTDKQYDCWLEESMALITAVYEGVNDRFINEKNMQFNYTIEEVTESSILNDRCKTTVVTEADKGNRPPARVNVEANPSIHIHKGDSKSNNKMIGRTGASDRKVINNVMDAEFKKANELTPTLLHVRVYPYASDTKEALDPIDFVIGVKATLHPISSTDMVLNLARGIRNDSLFFNFIRWTTGETKFFKDFLFALDQQKIDAANAGNSAGGWWSALKRRKASAQLKKFNNKAKGCLPNATLVCSVNDLDTLKSEYGYDLTGSDTSLPERLMNQYFLLAFVRVNAALERVDFLFDGTTQFETTTFSTLSKEGGNDDRKFKEMMKMLGRGM